MAARRDRVDISGLDHVNVNEAKGDVASRSAGSSGQPRRFLSVWFRCCHTYGRMLRNAAGTAYEGRCPRCGAPVRAVIGPGGTNRRVFEAE